MTHLRKLLASTTIIVALVSHSLPGQLPRESMDRYLSRLSQFGASGAALVVRGGEIIYQKGFGLAERAGGVPMSIATGVDIASMSKDLTGVAILQLEERGLLRRSDSLAKYFPSIPADKRSITIEQLLTHRSGLPSFFVDGNDFTPLTRNQAQDSIFAAKLEFSPGTDEGYSDAGYVLLAIILEQRTGGSLEEWLMREQFRPAGMTRTYSYASAGLRNAKQIAHGYVDSQDKGSAATYVANENYWVVKGAGGIVSTVEDIAKWEVALLTGKLLRTESLALLLGTGIADSTALAGVPEQLPSGRRGWIRTGSQDFGFSAGAIRYSDKRTVAVVAINRQPEGMDIAFLRTRLLMELDRFSSGTAPAAPPAGLPVPAAASGMAGSYQLDDGSRLRVTSDTESLMIVPDGALAVELLSFPADTSGRAERLALAPRAEVILRRLCQGDLAPLRESIARPSERIESYLKSAACGDSTTRIRATGTVPRWWGRLPSLELATLIELVGREKTTRIRFEWKDGRISAVGGGGIVAPVVRFVATNTPHVFAGYHLGIGQPVTLQWSARPGEADRLVFGSGGVQGFTAHRVAANPPDRPR